MAVASSPQVLGVLAHDLRWTIVGLLVPGDLRTSELVARTGQAPSLVSYHLARLRDAGLVSARRSAADGRDSYHALDLDALGQAVAGAAARIHPGLLAGRSGPAGAAGPAGPAGPPGPLGTAARLRRTGQVLFICSGNSARSPMAEGWLNHLGGGQVTARSAGVTPGALHPLAVAAMAEHGVDISGHRATRLDAFAGHTFTRVITLCDRARESCGELPAAGQTVHWSIPNPVQAHPPDLDAFRATARELRTRIRYLLAAAVRELPS
ncbi:MAG TPA: ArsR family transcriptional regulator [Streptosporangiaceae bacterium]|nr:ArsR family transcriptional regulator [Streptosporangiaceae bacterium]